MVAPLRLGSAQCKRILEELKEVGLIEMGPKLEGKKLMMILGPNPAAKKKTS